MTCVHNSQVCKRFDPCNSREEYQVKRFQRMKSKWQDCLITVNQEYQSRVFTFSLSSCTSVARKKVLSIPSVMQVSFFSLFQVIAIKSIMSFSVLITTCSCTISLYRCLHNQNILLFFFFKSKAWNAMLSRCEIPYNMKQNPLAEGILECYNIEFHFIMSKVPQAKICNS